MANSLLPDESWDATLRATGGHFLQSAAWMRVQAALGFGVTYQRGPAWQWAAAVRPGRFPRYLYVPYGPACASDATDALRDVVAGARSLELDFARVEPAAGAVAALRAVGARRAPQVQPRWTWVLDLSPDIDSLRAGLERGHRSRINAAPRRGIAVRETSDPADIDIFLGLRHQRRGRRAFRGQPAAYHRTVAQTLMPIGAASLYVATAGDRPVAASICFDFGRTRYYAHAASDDDAGRRLGTGPPLLWQMILDAKARGRTSFDFWGVIPKDDPSHPWNGFSRFKKAFGGQLVERSGTWEVPVRKARYLLYTAARRG